MDDVSEKLCKAIETIETSLLPGFPENVHESVKRAALKRVETLRKEATNYYPGFEALFRIPVAPVDEDLVFHLPDQLSEHAASGEKIPLASGLLQTIGQLRPLRTRFDVALLYLPESWAACFAGENFDFHDYLKAFTVPHGIPLQIVRQKSMERTCRANVMCGA